MSSAQPEVRGGPRTQEDTTTSTPVLLEVGLHVATPWCPEVIRCPSSLIEETEITSGGADTVLPDGGRVEVDIPDEDRVLSTFRRSGLDGRWDLVIDLIPRPARRPALVVTTAGARRRLCARREMIPQAGRGMMRMGII